jgi:Copper type II ascorbate-dependent monooxygenase, C-terminal domain
VNPGFLYANILTDKERSVLSQWVKAGMPRGDGREPKLILFPSLAALQKMTIGAADFVLSPLKGYRLKKGVIDDYRAYVIDPKFTEDKYIKMLTFVPGDKKVVHHITTFLLTSEEEKERALRMDAQDPAVGYQSDGTGLGFEAGIGAWAPGGEPLGTWPGQARLIPKGALFVMEVHYHQRLGEDPAAEDIVDHSKIELNLYKNPATEVIETINTYLLRTENVDIPPSARQHEVRTEITIPFDITLYGFGPHMHKTGHKFEARAYQKDAQGEPSKLLLKVDDWDFNWQGAYVYDNKSFVNLPSGSQIQITCTFNNSEENEEAPRPIRRIKWGPGTDNEMCEIYIGYSLTYLPKVVRGLNQTLSAEEMRLMEQNKKDPTFKKRSSLY